MQRLVGAGGALGLIGGGGSDGVSTANATGTSAASITAYDVDADLTLTSDVTAVNGPSSTLDAGIDVALLAQSWMNAAAAARVAAGGHLRSR